MNRDYGETKIYTQKIHIVITADISKNVERVKTLSRLLQLLTYSFSCSDFLSVHNGKCPTDSTDIEHQITNEWPSCELE